VLFIRLISSVIGIPVIMGAGALVRPDRQATADARLRDPRAALVDLLAVTVSECASALVHGPLASFLASLFEPAVRYSGASPACQLAMAWLLASTGTSASVSAFLLVMSMIMLLSVIFLRGPSRAWPTGRRWSVYW
jgi:hypothetical protein